MDREKQEVQAGIRKTDAIAPIDSELVALVVYTANQISVAKGHTISFKEAEVRIVLQAVRLVNAVSNGQPDAMP